MGNVKEEKNDAITYIVASETNHEPYIIILGTYASLAEAKLSIDNNVRLLMNGQVGTLSIYAVPFEQFRLQKFHGNEEVLASAKDRVKQMEVIKEMLLQNDIEGDSRKLTSLDDIIAQDVKKFIKNNQPIKLVQVEHIPEVKVEKVHEPVEEIAVKPEESPVEQNIQSQPDPLKETTTTNRQIHFRRW